jgi:hypothetical protein
VVEHRLAKARVAGSSPVSRSRWLPSEPPVAFSGDSGGSNCRFPSRIQAKNVAAQAIRRKSGSFACLQQAGVIGKSQICQAGPYQPGGTMFKMARYPSGKGEVCKTFMRRFDSDPRLQLKTPTNAEFL